MTNTKSQMTKGAAGFPFVIGDLCFVIPWSLVIHQIGGSLMGH
jgi:hypothetical protein